MFREWTCSYCGKLLGYVRSGRLHIHFARGYHYIVGAPANSVCRKCGLLNELTEADCRGDGEVCSGRD